MDLNKVFSEDKLKKNDELQIKLNQAESKIKSFDEKWKHQNQAIQTAKQELYKLRKSQDVVLLEKEKLQKDLVNEQHKSVQLEQEILLLKQQQKEQQQKSGLSDAFQVKRECVASCAFREERTDSFIQNRSKAYKYYLQY